MTAIVQGTESTQAHPRRGAAADWAGKTGTYLWNSPSAGVGLWLFLPRVQPQQGDRLSLRGHRSPVPFCLFRQGQRPLNARGDFPLLDEPFIPSCLLFIFCKLLPFEKFRLLHSQINRPADLQSWRERPTERGRLGLPRSGKNDNG